MRHHADLYLQYDLSLSMDDFYAIVADVRRQFSGCITMGHGHIGDGLYITNINLDHVCLLIIFRKSPSRNNW